MKIAVSDPEFYFALFYVLSFAVTLLLIVTFSIRQKIPLWSVFLLLTTASLFTIIGSRFITIPVNEWAGVIRSGDFAGHSGRSAIGGLVFGLAALILSARFLGLGKSVLDMYAWISPIGFGIQKIGCFFNGCCYGIQSDLPWSIKYPTGTSAHFHHYFNGMIDGQEGLSLNVHPVQIYEMLLFFGIAYLVWRTLNYWKKSGSSLLFSLFLFLIFRFIFEFLRDPDSSGFSNNTFLGVRVFQWVLLILGIVFGLALLWNESRRKPLLGKYEQAEPTVSKSIIYIISVSAIIYIFRGLFTPFELISLDIRFVPAILLMAYRIYNSYPVLRLRLATTSFLVLPLVFLSQSLPDDTLKRVRPIKDFYKNDVNTYKRVDFGTSIGTYNSALEYNPQQGECGTTYSTEAYEYVYRVLGGGYSTVNQENKLTTSKGINLWGGLNKEINISNSDEKTRFLFGVNPFIKYDFRWFGIGFGAHAGNLRWVPQAPSKDFSVPDATKFFVILPEFMMRLGRQDILDLKYSYGFNSPTMFPVVMNELSLGSGFGNKTNYSFRYGVAFSDNNSNQFISAEGLVDKKVGLIVKYNFGNSSNYGPSPDLHGRIQLGFNYRFGFEK